ncbi:MATE family efflux transporter [Cytobacillus oceanisediminis]|uniref:MATE family efflux transporter n=1 Tax=Cytobacillus oceanisediminis TaxID=665099 RepID=UPI0023DC11F8|nr:MATE family efflux transporter [Cytobacillus oceanisediminis]MDF2039927.1 MATE family efflux transporter [Cytobacillus oceanisediminis]
MKHRTYLALVFPLLLSSLTTPLLGATDTAIAGRFSDASYIGGVAVGTLIFNTLYWLFGFLRVATSGFTAQADGSGEKNGLLLSLLRPLAIALFMGVVFLLLQMPILAGTLALIGAEPAVEESTSAYFSIRIWGAPFVLAGYVILGWLMGVSEVRKTFILVLMSNSLNILLSIWFALGMDWGMKGLAAGTMLSEVVSAAVGAWMVKRKLAITLSDMQSVARNSFIEKNALMKMFKVNRDLFIRTACLLLAFQLFTISGAAFGTNVLAANAVLMQVQFLMVYVYDGFANGSSILAGRAIGRKDVEQFKLVTRMTKQWSFFAPCMIVLVFLFADFWIWPVFTNLKEVLTLIDEHSFWLAIVAFAASFGVVGYGIFTGATEVSYVRNSMVLAAIFYVMAIYPLTHFFGNHGLWASFILFCLCRSFFLWLYVPDLLEKIQTNIQQAAR